VLEIVLNTLAIEDSLQSLRIEWHCEQEGISLEELGVGLETLLLPSFGCEVDYFLWCSWTCNWVSWLGEDGLFELLVASISQLLNSLEVVNRGDLSGRVKQCLMEALDFCRN
jgi:hypothetical protein